MIVSRLLLPAATVWLGAALTSAILGLAGTLVQRHERAAVAAWIGAGLLLAIAIAVALLHDPRTRAFGGLIGCAAAPLGILVAAIHVLALTSAPVAGWVDARATSVVRGVIVTEPLIRVVTTSASWQASSRLEARLATTQLTSRGTTIEQGLPIVVRLPIGMAVPPPGSEVEIVGRLAPVPWRVDAAAELTVVDAGAILARTAPGPLDVVAHAMRMGMRRAVADLPPDAGSLVAGLAIGDESGQSPDLADAMRASGLSHLTAVSGGNVAIVLVVVMGAAGMLRLGLVGRSAIGLAAIAFFVVLVGPQPSVLRAGVMGGVVVLGVIAGGRRAGPSVLAASVIVLVVTAPALAVSWAFALSVFATGGLILLAPRLDDRLATWPVTRRWPPALRGAVGLTAAAQLATLPVLVAMGGATGWVSLAANLLAMPAVAPITVLGLGAACISPVAATPSAVLAHAASWPAAWIACVAHWAAGLPLRGVPLPAGGWGVVTLVAVALLWRTARPLVNRLWPDGVPRSMRLTGACLVLGALAIGIVLPPDRGWPPAGWFMIVCDVGQGDAILLRSGPQEAVVVDAGPDPDLVDACLDDAGIASVPAVVLTHFHADHVAGLSGVFRDRSVAQVLVSAVRDPADQASDVDRVLSSHGMRAAVITAGDARTVGAVAWTAIWPRRVIQSGSIPNNASIVLLATVSGHRTLLSGDIEPEAQAAVSADLAGQHFDVVKVPHHGSRFQHPMLTSWAPASIALISVGLGNDYGHPAAETIASWLAIGAIVGRTDLQGDLAVVDVDTSVGLVARSRDAAVLR